MLRPRGLTELWAESVGGVAGVLHGAEATEAPDLQGRRQVQDKVISIAADLTDDPGIAFFIEDAAFRFAG
jgi:hypothetical protein